MNILEKVFAYLGGRGTPKPDLDPSISPALIAVTGCTGTGISTFINAITGSDAKRISPEGIMEAQTSGIRPVPVNIEGIRRDQTSIVLVDTPGMDFANGPNFKATFNNLNKWKNDKYGKEATFTGIIFVHRQVNQSLPDGELSIQHNAILIKLLGVDWRDKMVLAHNYRQAVGHDEPSEELLKIEDGWGEGFWKHVTRVDKIQRFDFKEPQESALKILRSLAEGTHGDLGNNLTTHPKDQRVTPTSRLRDSQKAPLKVNSRTPDRRA